MSFGLGLTKSWEGQMRKAMTEEARHARVAATNGMRVTGDRWKAAARAKLVEAGFSQRFSQTITVAVYPKGSTISLSPAANMVSRAPHIFESLTRGSLIKGRGNAGWLAIALPTAPKAARGRRMTYAEALKRFGDPKILKTKTGFLALFPTVLGKNGTSLRKASKRRIAQNRDVSWTPMFVFVRQVQMPKRIAIESTLAAAGDQLKPNIAAAWPASTGARS